jgi:ADP-heptose:LPS heptosyltransferase
MATPAIRAFRKCWDGELYMLLNNEEFQKIHLGNPYVDGCIMVSGEEKDKIINKYPRCKDSSFTAEKHEGKNKTGGIDRVIVLDTSLSFSWCSIRPVKLHLCYGYAAQLGVSIDSTRYDINLTEEEIQEGKDYLRNFKHPVILCGALSSSCTSQNHIRHPGSAVLPANKMLSSNVWNAVIEKYKGEYDFVFLGSEKEETIPVNAEWAKGLPIRKVAAMCKSCEGVISIDTGIGHIAAGVGANIVSINSAVPRNLVSVDGGTGKYYCIDRYQFGGIQSVTPEDIIEGIKIFKN